MPANGSTEPHATDRHPLAAVNAARTSTDTTPQEAPVARDHARFPLALWDDDTFCDLSPLAQWLYFLLLSHPSLSQPSACGHGVMHWRPEDLATYSRTATAEDVQAAGDDLARAGLIVGLAQPIVVVLGRPQVCRDGVRP